ncbi:MAG: class I SAM-dependent methyltransferase [Anaerolineales bacterium]|nr:class I SAM-dependent methyltransferase [Anaerolineales bacterium]
MHTPIERLDFLLPDFVRRSWVSDDARAVWEPRLQRITHAWFDIEWRAVLAGVRACGVTIISPQAFIEKAGVWAAHGLNALPVELQGLNGSSYASTGIKPELGKPFVYRVVVGTPASVTAFKAAWDGDDHQRIGELLGYPACCHSFFHDVWVQQGMIDTTWPMAANTAGATAVATEPYTLALSGPPEANILWRWMGIRAVPHLPCSFTCAATVALGQQMVQVGRDAGYDEEMDWLLEILSWPVEWSALHGIAEIKTPVLKVSTRSDATPHKYVVRRAGSSYPAQGVSGLAFPYQLNRAPRLTGSAAFQRGLDNPIPVQSVSPAWLAADNGFASVLAMAQAHEPIVQLATAVLADKGDNVIDLGCGNGALLQKIVTAVPTVVPYGCDLDAARIAHAQQLQPHFAANFACADLFDPDAPIWAAQRRYQLALLMPGRLLEVDAARAAFLKQWLQQHCANILLYAYGDWLTRYQNLDGLAAQAGLTLLNPDEDDVVVGLARINI